MAAQSNPNLRFVLRLVIVIVALAIVLISRELRKNPNPPDVQPIPANNGTGDGKPIAAGPGEYLFCFWNVENLFDDKDDQRGRADEEYDTWFTEKPDDLKHKLERLTAALLKLNGGKGPDILCVCEVESLRAAELLQLALNAKLPPDAVKYEPPLMKEVSAGRHIAPALLTRLPANRDRTKGYGTSRILEVHLEANGKELVVFASHWTSQLTDHTGEGRAKYADKIYGRIHAMYKSNPKIDVILCGDFNAEPDLPEVRENLRAVADLARLNTTDDSPTLLNLMAGKDPKAFGTHYYSKPLIYDHLVVSPGMLDTEGWACEPASVQTVTDGLIRSGATRRQPWRFGNRKDDQNRGYSDHFPVTVKLRVQ